MLGSTIYLAVIAFPSDREALDEAFERYDFISSNEGHSTDNCAD